MFLGLGGCPFDHFPVILRMSLTKHKSCDRRSWVATRVEHRRTRSQVTSIIAAAGDAAGIAEVQAGGGAVRKGWRTGGRESTGAGVCRGIHVHKCHQYMYKYIHIHIHMVQRCLPPPPWSWVRQVPPPVVVVLWLGCGGLGLVQNWFRVYLGCI